MKDNHISRSPCVTARGRIRGRRGMRKGMRERCWPVRGLRRQGEGSYVAAARSSVATAASIQTAFSKCNWKDLTYSQWMVTAHLLMLLYKHSFRSGPLKEDSQAPGRGRGRQQFSMSSWSFKDSRSPRRGCKDNLRHSRELRQGIIGFDRVPGVKTFVGDWKFGWFKPPTASPM